MYKSTFLVTLASIFCLSFTTTKPHQNEKPYKPAAAPSAGIFLYSSNITTGAGIASGHLDEVNITVEQGGMTNPSSKPALSDFVLTKQFDLSTMKIQKALLSSQYNNFEIRYYDGVSVEPVYSIGIKNGLITSYSESSQGCSGGCPLLDENFTIGGFSSISWTYANNGNPQTLTYNVATSTVN